MEFLCLDEGPMDPVRRESLSERGKNSSWISAPSAGGPAGFMEDAAEDD